MSGADHTRGARVIRLRWRRKTEPCPGRREEHQFDEKHKPYQLALTSE